MIIKEKGIITQLMPEVNGTSKAGNAYTIREFVIEVNDEGYKNNIHFKAMGNTVRDLEDAKAGDPVEVTYKPTSREHNGRWYDEMRLFSVRITRQPQTTKEEDASNDLPF
ncbi:MAG: DUF3127 domain-containing protein [Bacteroidales bacterium]|nr:DUF3127 domain-containing protein [Bacteroidales bacterium]